MTTPSADGFPELGPQFELPLAIADDPEMVVLYHDSIRKLISESRGLPMHTVQEFLLERIATKYVIMKWRERSNTWVGVNTEKDYASGWLDLVKEWNKVLASGQQQLRDAIMSEVEVLLVEGLEQVADDATRKTLRLYFKEAFARLG